MFPPCPLMFSYLPCLLGSMRKGYNVPTIIQITFWDFCDNFDIKLIFEYLWFVFFTRKCHKVSYIIWMIVERILKEIFHCLFAFCVSVWPFVNSYFQGVPNLHVPCLLGSLREGHNVSTCMTIKAFPYCKIEAIYNQRIPHYGLKDPLDQKQRIDYTLISQFNKKLFSRINETRFYWK